MGDKTDSELLNRLKGDPDGHVDLIVTTDDDPQLYEPRLRALNIEVKRTFSLTKKLAAGGSARSFLVLSRENWVEKMEEDKPVRAIDRNVS